MINETSKQARSNQPASSPPDGVPGDAGVWYIVALLTAALGTLVIGYFVGTSIEGNSAEKTLEANRAQATSAIETLNAQMDSDQVQAAAVLSTSVAQGNNAVATREAQATAAMATSRAENHTSLATREAEATAAVASREAESRSAISTREAQATAAIGQVTQTVGEQQTATANAQATQTAIVEAYTPTPTNTATSTATATPEIAQGEVLPITVAVRLGPGTEYPVVDNIGQQTPVEILSISDDGAWIEIQYVNDEDAVVTGFVLSEVVRHTGGSLQGIQVAQGFPTLTYTPTLVPSPTYTPTVASPTPSTPEAAVVAIAVTVYAGPGENYAILDVIAQDTPVQILGASADGQWFQISYQRGEGFVRVSSLRLTGGSLTNVGIAVASAPTITPTPPPPTPSSPAASASGQFVVVREGPGEVFPVVGVVSASEPLEVTAVSTDGLWFQVVFERAPDSEGWVSGQVVNVGGDLSVLPAVQGPPPPVSTTTTSNTAVGSAASTSAGSLNPVDAADLPDSFSINYNGIPNLDAYAYELAFAVTGVADGEEYQSLLRVGYAQAPDQAKVAMDMSGGFLQSFEGEDLETLSNFLPLQIGVYSGTGYFFTEGDGLCFELGPNVDLTEVTGEFDMLFDEGGLSFFNDLPENAVFGVVDRNGLMGIPGVHYQYLGNQENGQIVPSDDIKIDLWWTEDESLIYGYRLTINIDSEFFFLYRDTLATIDPSFNDVDTFEGTITFYLLPTGSGEQAIELAAPPNACDDILSVE